MYLLWLELNVSFFSLVIAMFIETIYLSRSHCDRIPDVGIFEAVEVNVYIVIILGLVMVFHVVICGLFKN